MQAKKVTHKEKYKKHERSADALETQHKEMSEKAFLFRAKRQSDNGGERRMVCICWDGG